MKLRAESYIYLQNTIRNDAELDSNNLGEMLTENLRPKQIDEVISAEIPNPETDQKLYDTVTKNMIHGPCGALNLSSLCMEEGKCTKKYPRALLKNTQTNDKAFPLYRRRAPEDDCRTIT
ncbi:uncharacterized protein TNCV_2797281 [Trichonephila clavipes]|nr:uncharacterized protein TNCV_2797281 [Trichonephila clavipes]